MMLVRLCTLFASAAVALGIGSSAARADWQYEVKNDPFTDKRIASWVRGRAVLNGRDYQLIYECQASTGTPVFVLPVREGLPELAVQFRVDKNPPHKSVWRQLAPRGPEFRMTLDDWQAIQKESDASSDLVVSAETTDAILSGERSIVHFDMRGFRLGVEKVDADCRNKR